MRKISARGFEFAPPFSSRCVPRFSSTRVRAVSTPPRIGRALAPSTARAVSLSCMAFELSPFGRSPCDASAGGSVVGVGVVVVDN